MATPTFSRRGALTDAEQDRLAGFLESSGRAMSLEMLDGFFAVLIAGPEVVPPSEYLAEVFGGELAETCAFADLDEANEILRLLLQHWNHIAATLHHDDVYLPILYEDDQSICLGTEWAQGFMRGVAMRREAWAPMFYDEEQAGWLVPVLMLYHEHDEDPELRPGPIGLEQRQEVIAQMAAGIVGTFRYFRQQRAARGHSAQTVARRVGRNDPCSWRKTRADPSNAPAQAWRGLRRPFVSYQFTVALPQHRLYFFPEPQDSRIVW